MRFQPWAIAKMEPVTISGKIAGNKTRLKYCQPLILKTLAAEIMSCGIIFIPPTRVKTVFQSILKNKMKMAARSSAPNLKNKKIKTGKKANIGTDSKISKTGKRIFSATAECVAKIAKGIATIMAKI